MRVQVVRRVEAELMVRFTVWGDELLVEWWESREGWRGRRGWDKVKV